MHLHQEVMQANGVALNAATAGSGPLVVLLHGFPYTHAFW
jgi:haloacetate dehalogenase